MDFRKSLRKLHSSQGRALKQLKYTAKIKNTRLRLYGAGRKFDHTNDYFRVFPRDSFTSIFLLEDKQFLKNLLIFCVKTQGSKYDPLTGEEPGKILHEWPGVALRGRDTLYASVDATALFLIGMRFYWNWTKDKNFIVKNRESIKNATEYVLRHIRNNLFWDDPAYCGANKYALWSGCWRDGGYPERKNREHIYPASYFMVNIFVVSALRSLAYFNESKILHLDSADTFSKLADRIRKMTLSKFWLPAKGYFASALDEKGKIETLYLDSVWSLYFLNKQDVPITKVQSVFDKLKKLETPFGYISRERLPGYDFEGGKKTVSLKIWPYEHAYLAMTSKKYGIKFTKEKALLPIKVLSRSRYPFSEYIMFDKEKPVSAGCHIQLWTIAYINAMYNLQFTNRKFLFAS